MAPIIDTIQPYPDDGGNPGAGTAIDAHIAYVEMMWDGTVRRTPLGAHAPWIPDQVETIRWMANRAGRGVSAAQVHRVAVREGLAVLERTEVEAEQRPFPIRFTATNACCFSQVERVSGNRIAPRIGGVPRAACRSVPDA